MKKTYLLFLASVILLFINSVVAPAAETELWRNGISLIPYPRIVEMGGDDFVLDKQIDILIDKGALPEDVFAAEELRRRLMEEWNVKCSITEVSSGRNIALTRQGAPEEVGDQGYRIETSANRLTIRANGAAGLFYGTQSLLQIIQNGRQGLYVKGMVITDWPDIS